MARAEAIFLGLRQRTGVEAATFAGEFGDPPRRFFATRLDRLIADGLLAELQNGDLILTARGRLLADTVALQFV